MRTTQGPQRVDVIYRRHRRRLPRSAGVPARLRAGRARPDGAYRAGSVTIANAIGTGVADDKAIYSYVPEMIRFYLGEEPILDNVPTWRCREPDDLAYVLDHLDRTGGQGGPRLGRLRHAGRARRPTKARDRGIPPAGQGRARTTTSPSRPWRCRPARPSSRTGVAPRHVDLRPFVLIGRDGMRIVPGGLTRVALKRRLAGGQFQPGRRHQGHLGARGRKPPPQFFHPSFSGGRSERLQTREPSRTALNAALLGDVSRLRQRFRLSGPLRSPPAEKTKAHDPPSPHRGIPVLERQLHGAGRLRRPAARRGRQLSTLPTRETTRTRPGKARSVRRASVGLPCPPDGAPTRRRLVPVPGLRSGQSLLDPGLPDHRALQHALDPYGPDHGALGDGRQHLRRARAFQAARHDREAFARFWNG